PALGLGRGGSGRDVQLQLGGLLAARPRRPAGGGDPAPGRGPRPWLAGGPGHGPPPGARPPPLPSCSSTVAAWPSALTLCQARSTRPCSSSRKVERSTPSEVRP